MNFKGNRKAPQYAEDITLDEKVKTLPPDSIIAIGAAARFFYIGTAKEWLRTEKDIDKRTAEDKLKIWEEAVKGKKLAAKRNGTVYIEPPKPEISHSEEESCLMPTRASQKKTHYQDRRDRDREPFKPKRLKLHERRR